MRIVLAAVALVATPVAAQDVYFGNLHAHTSYSDGRGLPDDAYQSAREAGLDFFAVTEHNHDEADGKGDARDGLLIATRPELYSGTQASNREAALRHTEDGMFVALFGQEYSTISSGNHVNVFEVPEVLAIAEGDFPALLAAVRAMPDAAGRPPLLQFNHPRSESRSHRDYGRDDFANEREWVEAMDPLVEQIEVLNAPALRDGIGFRAHARQGEFFRYLNLGFHVSPSVGHDNHYRNWGTSTDARVAVIADALTRESLLEAMRGRHTYATEDRNLKIVFRANGALSGDIAPLPSAESELDLTVTLYDGDEPDASYRIDVFQDAPGGPPASRPANSYEVTGNSDAPIRLDGVVFKQPGEYVLLRVTQFSDDEHGEEDRAWTAPVWFEAATPQLVSSAVPVRIVGLVPNPAGDERLLEEISLRNLTDRPVPLDGWSLRDLADQLWTVDDEAPLAPGETRRIRRNGKPMALNNGGDTVELIDPSGASVQTVEYGPADEGQAIEP